MSHPGSQPPAQPQPSHEDHLATARRLARRYSCAGLPSEDLQQEAACAALEASLSYDPHKHACLADHVARVIRRRLHQLCRDEARSRHSSLPPDVLDRGPDPLEEADRRDFWVAARLALSPRRYLILRLSATGHADRDIALDLGISRAAVRQERRRAIRQLRGE